MNRSQLIDVILSSLIAICLGGVTKIFFEAGNWVGVILATAQYLSVYSLWVWEEKTEEEKHSFISNLKGMSVARYFFECRRGGNVIFPFAGVPAPDNQRNFLQ